MDRPDKSNYLNVKFNKELMGDLEEKIEKLHSPRAPSSQEQNPEKDAKSFPIDPRNRNELRPIRPPYSFKVLADLYENSNALRQNIDAMITNIDGNGWALRPTINFSSEDVEEEIKDLILSRRINEHDDLTTLTDEQILNSVPTDEEIEEEAKKLQILSKFEFNKILNKIKFINPDTTFIDIRKDTRRDLELFGNAAWEVIRDEGDDITQIVYVPFVNIRLLPRQNEAVQMSFNIKENDIDYDKLKVEKYFRRFVQKTNSMPIFFKEYGDPRVMSRKTGKYFESLEELKKEEGQDSLPANELYHWKITTPVSSYGIPRWIGNLLSVLGSRSAEEVNYLYFKNKSVPPLAIVANDTQMSKSTIKRIEDFIDSNIKGQDNFHNILILEGISSQDSDANPSESVYQGKPRIDIVPLTEAQQNDSLFPKYDQLNRNKVGESFRIPPILRGDTKDFNRSTAQIAKAFAEEQVFQPERDSFDSVMNRFFLSDWKVRFWKFETQAPVNRDPEVLTRVISELSRTGVLTPNDGRMIVEDILNKRLKKINFDWTKVPVEVGRAFAQQGAMADVLGFESGLLPEREQRPGVEVDEEDQGDMDIEENEDLEKSISDIKDSKIVGVVIPMSNGATSKVSDILKDKNLDNLDEPIEIDKNDFVELICKSKDKE